MGPIERAVDKFRLKRSRVYEADPDQIVRDSRVAERAIKDHVGRWLFEVLQNSDDAKASKVLIHIEEDTVYVGDNGRGLKPKAVDAISGTDFSDKNVGTIGRKGVGFKSVYELSASPQVLTVNGEGVEFCREKAENWLRHNRLNCGHVPYQWIPFFVSWHEARQNDPTLVKFADYKTVVRLPNIFPDQKQKIEKLLCEWPRHTLLAFLHVRELRADPDLLVRISEGDRIWEMQGTERDAPLKWNIVKNREMAPEVMSEVVGEEWRTIK